MGAINFWGDHGLIDGCGAAQWLHFLASSALPISNMLMQRVACGSCGSMAFVE
jgi:ribosomal protein S27AE